MPGTIGDCIKRNVTRKNISNPLTKDTAAKLANLIPQFHSRKLGFNISLYNDLIHFHIKRNKFDDVQKVLNTLQTEKPFSPLSQRTLALIMAMHLKSGNTVELDRLTQRQENGIAHYMAQFVQWTRGLQLNDSHFQRAKQIFYSLQGARCEPNTPRFTHLLGHLIHSGKHAEAIQLFNHIVDIGYPVNHYTSTQIMSGLLQAKQFDKATTIWERIKNLPDRGVADLQVVNSLLEVYSQDPKRLEAAKELWIHMNQTPGLEPDQFSFASMLSAYIGSNDPTSVIELWQSMQQEPYSIKPNTVLYNLAINGLFYNRQPEQAKQLYEEFLTRQDLQSTSIDMYHTMIRGLLSVRDLEALQKILSRMERDNVKPNSTTYTLMSDILFSQHDSEGGTKMAGLIQENSLPKTAISYSALIAGHAKNGDLARAREIYEEMQAAGFEPSIHTFGALMQGAFRSGQVAVAEEMAEMAKNKIKDGMSLGAYSIMIGGYSNLVMLDDAERWFYEMQRTQSAMPWETYYVLLRACVEHREWDIAQRVLKAMKDKPFKSHVPKLNELIQQVERVQAGKPALVLYRSSHKKICKLRGTPDCPPSVLLHFDQKRYMINCGEGVQRLCTEQKVRCTKLQTLLFTRTNWDCTGGLPDLKVRHITLLGPQNLTHTLLASRHFLFRNTTNVESIEFGGDMADEGPIFNNVGDDHPSKGARTQFQDENLRITSVLVYPTTATSNSNASSKSSCGAPSCSESSRYFTNQTDLEHEQRRRDSRIRQQELGAMFTLWTFPPVSWAPSPVLPEHSHKKPTVPQSNNHHEQKLHCTCQIENTQKAQAGERSLQGLRNMLQGSHPDLPPTQPNPVAISYICQTADYQGKFDKAAALTLGVKPGPIFKDLLNGKPVVSSTTGEMVYPSQVIQGARPGRVFVVIDCPSVEYISGLVSSPEFSKFYQDDSSAASTATAVTRLDKVECIVHLAGQAVMTHPKYLAWMAQFGSDTQHLLAHQDYCGQGLVFSSQATCSLKLSKLNDTIFPVPFYDNTPSCKIALDNNNTNEANKLKIQVAKNMVMFGVEPTVGFDFSEKVGPIVLPKDFQELEKHNSVALKEYSEQADAVLEDIAMQQQHHPVADSMSGQDYPGSNVSLTALGTGSSRPSKYRNVSSTLLDIPERGSILLDVGEGTYGQMFRHFGGNKRNSNQRDSVEDRLKNLKGIFISHLHADHHLGIVTILSEWNKLRDESTDPLYLIAPEKFHNFLTEVSHTQDFGYQHVRFIDSSDLIFGTMSSSTTSTSDEHSDFGPPETPIYTQHSNSTAESQSQSRTHLDTFLQLTGFKEITTVVMIHCYNAFGICMTHNDGWKFVFSGDSRPSQDLVIAGAGATVVLHEATFEDDMLDQAIKKRHSTTCEAIDVAQSMGAQAVLLTHFSQRYPKVPQFDPRGREKLAIGICFDLMTIRLGDIWRLQKFAPALAVLYGNDGEGNDETNGDDGGEEASQAILDAVVVVANNKNKNNSIIVIIDNKTLGPIWPFQHQQQQVPHETIHHNLLIAAARRHRI
ncbi:tRNAse Z trz4, mitochondrial, partial [Podila humilis]